MAYLFYSPSSSNWLSGSSYTSSSSGVKSTGNAGAACPDQATGWQVWTGFEWESAYPIAVVQAAVGN